MTVVMQDGRRFVGTPLQIVQAMQAIAFVPELDVVEYMQTLVLDARRFAGVDLTLPSAEEGADAMAAALVRQMVATGLAYRMPLH